MSWLILVFNLFNNQQSFTLSNLCANVTIVEYDKISKNDIQYIDNICNKAVFDSKTKLLHSIKISLLKDSENFNQLNDLKYRFKNRNKYVLGSFSRTTNHIYITDKIDSNFDNILRHEIYHVLSWHNKLHLSDIEEEYNAKLFGNLN